MEKQYAITQFISNYYELCNLVVFIIAKNLYSDWRKISQKIILMLFSLFEIYFLLHYPL